MTTVRKCSCKNDFQDETYGHGNRLFNIGPLQVKCTVCGRIIKEEVKKSKKED